MADALGNTTSTLDNPPVSTGPIKGARKGRGKNKDTDESEDGQMTKAGDGAFPSVPTVGDETEKDESLKIRIKLNLQARVRIDLDADIKGEVVIGLL